jgi:hypothetical protein
MEELDLLKKDWKKSENSFEQISENEIYKMLHTKSSSIVKWILVISILEVLFWASISLLFNTDDYLLKLKHPELIEYFKIFNYFNYAVILLFIMLFYRNYRSITTTVSTKQLMRDILKTRKTVHYYVYYNLTMIILSMLLGFYLAFTYNPEVVALRDKIFNNPKVMIVTFGILGLILIASFGIFWLFYRLLYGILLRKLYKNYNELKKIDL